MSRSSPNVRGPLSAIEKMAQMTRKEALLELWAKECEFQKLQ
jgi:hypothetical protein